MNALVTLRAERPEDTGAIRILTEDAFRPKAFSNDEEGALIDDLRAAGALVISTVACADDVIVGHVAFSPAAIGEDANWFGMGPISVREDLQRQGIGGQLIRDGLQQLRALGAHGCVLEGDPGYYGRFGFEVDAALTYRGAYSPYIQYLLLSGQAPSGEVRFHPAFDVVA